MRGYKSRLFILLHFPIILNFFLKDPGPLNSKNVFERLNNLTCGVTESRGAWPLKLNRGEPYLWNFHNAGCSR